MNRLEEVALNHALNFRQSSWRQRHSFFTNSSVCKQYLPAAARSVGEVSPMQLQNSLCLLPPSPRMQLQKTPLLPTLLATYLSSKVAATKTFI
jgi:hypothetical protein